MSGRAQPLPPLQGGMLVIATIGISVVTAMTVLDSTIANVALPTIAGNLGVASSQGTWVITFFGVANAIAIPPHRLPFSGTGQTTDMNKYS